MLVRLLVQARISTHTLTWSVTDENIARINLESISTHTLTWSVTCVSQLARK